MLTEVEIVGKKKHRLYSKTKHCSKPAKLCIYSLFQRFFSGVGSTGNCVLAKKLNITLILFELNIILYL